MSRPISIEYLDEIQLGFNQHDVDAILSHFAEDCVWLMARWSQFPGRPALCRKRGDWCRVENALHPDSRYALGRDAPLGMRRNQGYFGMGGTGYTERRRGV